MELAVDFALYGAEHIAFGYDHLLFLAGITLLSARVRDIAWVVLLFAVAYSSTLVGGALLGIAAPAAVIDTIIGISVGYVGAQLAFGGRVPGLNRDPRGPALVFGLAHGLGLSSLLQDLQLPGDTLLPSALGFNVGVELGQLTVIGILLGGLALFGALPIPARQRIPAGCALISASAVLVVLVHWQPTPAFGHGARPPAPPTAPPADVRPIPAEDEARYRSDVTRIAPPVADLEARIVGGDEKLELRWTESEPLVVIGTQGEPMLRLSDAGIEINERSPSAYLSADRYAEVALPGDVDADARPQWRLIDSPGPISWYEHRAHWMEAERPAIVGDGGGPATIFHWTVPVEIAGRRHVIRGALEWIPDPEAVRERVDVSDGALASGLILLAALAAGWFAGVRVRDRVMPA